MIDFSQLTAQQVDLIKEVKYKIDILHKQINAQRLCMQNVDRFSRFLEAKLDEYSKISDNLPVLSKKALNTKKFIENSSSNVVNDASEKTDAHANGVDHSGQNLQEKSDSLLLVESINDSNCTESPVHQEERKNQHATILSEIKQEFDMFNRKYSSSTRKCNSLAAAIGNKNKKIKSAGLAYDQLFDLCTSFNLSNFCLGTLAKTDKSSISNSLTMKELIEKLTDCESSKILNCTETNRLVKLFLILEIFNVYFLEKGN